ncbi:MAG: haloacid dehalogenase type II [Alphaproteobacteria bacterium]
MLDAAKIKALTFDVFGTVVDWHGSIAREVAAALPTHDIDGGAFANAWRARYQPAMERVRSGGRGFVKLDTLHRENLLETLAEFGVAGLSEADIDRLNKAWHRLDPWPDAVAGMQRLKRKFILASLSNGNVALIVNMAKRAGLPWDVVLGAEVAQAFKPQPQAYLRAAELLDLAPQECLMVAAHNSDLQAAAACGFRTAFIRRPYEWGKVAKTFDLEADPGIDLDVADFATLAYALGC